VIKIESGMCQLINGAYQVIEIPCKYIPFKALKVGETVKLNFRLKQEEIK
jgi:hypothetical protein